ncbi:uncharacterized protein BO87DRAFT_325372 [Aspergillus neoniger CBS 115656]|uniref:Non-homologous end-joining factor 1 n=1 Tax=Aspergillus neoniger (strain CBS 115656) TaxID=1448310 RepID=A0A318YVP5_ASPNB|nr:XLF-domain-containing protein [Aspergillus neoniger CBS 115656]PYH38509.1 XLF-domain-containing protein [Aspergillus neoniger CBS 115656]
MSARWEKLHISNRAPAPLLLYRYTLFRDGYELYLTDLTYIWSERPNRQHILGRAVEDDATIDPSQDIDQFNILLEKLGEALRNDPGTSTVLRRGRENDTLHLITTTSLPAPLEPLKWNFYMAREKQRFSTTQLLIPLIKSEAYLELRQRDLIEVVKKKDWLLSKLFDKLEAVGFDLSTIFPGIPGLRTSHKGSAQSQAAKYITGARPFDEESWLDENNAITAETGFASSILEETEDSNIDDNLLLLEDLTAPSDGWWRKMSTANNNTEDVDARTPEDSTNMDTTDGGLETEDDFDDDDDDDEFERQETPPRLRLQPNHQTPPLGPDEGTATESEDDLEDRNGGPSTARPRAPQLTSRGLATIGGNRKQPTQPESPQTSPASADVDEMVPTRKAPAPQADSDQTASETDDDNNNDNHPSPSPSPPPSTRQTKARGIGMIGGKKAEKQASPPSSPIPESSSKPQTKPRGLGVIGGKGKARQASPPSSPPPEAESSSKPQAKSHGLGVIGGRKRENQPTSSPAATATQSSGPPSPAPALDDQVAEPEKEETEEEKADRKREELKRQLEAKSKAPAKKKRKF